jgi:hypothetical protein
MRINSELIQTIFHTGDQRLLTNFVDLKNAEPIVKQKEENSEETWGVETMSITIKPKTGSVDDYDFVLSLKDPTHDEFFGIKGKDLVVSGHAVTMAGWAFDFEADITSFMVEIDELPETDPRILVAKESAVKYEQGTFHLDFSQFRYSEAGADFVEFTCEGMNTLLKENSEEMIRSEYTKLWNGEKETLARLPIESLLPLLLLKNLGSVSTSFDMDHEQLEYGFDPDLAFNRKITAKKAALLKDIDSKFITLEEG